MFKTGLSCKTIVWNSFCTFHTDLEGQPALIYEATFPRSFCNLDITKIQKVVSYSWRKSDTSSPPHVKIFLIFYLHMARLSSLFQRVHYNNKHGHLDIYEIDTLL